MIKRNSAKDFAIFNTYTEYKSEYDKRLLEDADPKVDDETICFISDEGTIYTHDAKFGGRSIYTEGNYIKISENAINVDYDKLKNRLVQDGVGLTNTSYAITNLDVANGRLRLE